MTQTSYQQQTCIKVASKAQVEAQKVVMVEVAGTLIAVCFAAGRFWAVSGYCPHQNKSLAEGYIVKQSIICPLHGAQFDLETGACLRKPATDPLTPYPLIETDTDLYLSIDAVESDPSHE